MRTSAYWCEYNAGHWNQLPVSQATEFCTFRTNVLHALSISEGANKYGGIHCLIGSSEKFATEATLSPLPMCLLWLRDTNTCTDSSKIAIMARRGELTPSRRLQRVYIQVDWRECNASRDQCISSVLCPPVISTHGGCENGVTFIALSADGRMLCLYLCLSACLSVCLSARLPKML